MAFLNENEWILLNEIAYNISFIYTVEEMQQEMLNRWLPFLIPYDAAIFARISFLYLISGKRKNIKKLMINGELVIE